MASERIAGLAQPGFLQASWALVLNGLTDLSSLAVGGTFFPKTIAALKAGAFKAAITGFLEEFFTSNTFQGLYEAGFRAYMRASGTNWTIRDGSGTLIGVNLLSQEDLVARNVAALRDALGKLARVIQLIKIATLVGDYAAIGKDLLASARVTEFTFDITKAKTSLSPKPFKVEQTGGQFPITVSVDGRDAAVPASSVFVQWTCTGKYGTLFQVGGSGTDQFESALTNPSHNYVPSGVDADPNVPETITAVAYYRNPATNGRIEMGRATVTVEFAREFSIELVPLAADVPTNTDVGVQATLREVLPPGAHVTWTWSSTGVGSIARVPGDTDKSSSSVTFSSGSAAGSAAITAKCTVEVPGLPARVIQVLPVTSTLTVKAGLKTLTVRGSWTTETIYTPLDGFTAFATTAYLTVPKVAGAVSYSVALTKPTPDVPGGVPFPSTRTFSPGSPSNFENRGGAWWSGLSALSGNAANGAPAQALAWFQSRFSDMVVVATVTLP